MDLKTQTSRQGRMAFAIAASVIVLDQLSKAWILYGVKLRERGFVELTPIFDLRMVWNQGMSFGLGQSGGQFGRWFFTVFAVGVSIAIGWWVRQTTSRWTAWSLGLVMGGALGNVIDRVRFGKVVDFLDFSGLMFPWVFNVADSAITVGVILLLVETFWPSAREVLASRRDRVN
ncbi:signal peptidase II [Caulobacter sp. 17J80-11]|uniref:signal peptidase II n=1 Tax=Caulobacter sp. 17J80-11 TaxID=2763502 RepID=UPI0016539114|nr:signal peptidase II [Caulobacter sp. 17J80-11]MBC6981019.1 signal peptidase II [Caulobacter sp. 17J80-11]